MMSIREFRIRVQEATVEYATAIIWDRDKQARASAFEEALEIVETWTDPETSALIATKLRDALVLK